MHSLGKLVLGANFSCSGSFTQTADLLLDLSFSSVNLLNISPTHSIESSQMDQTVTFPVCLQPFKILEGELCNVPDTHLLLTFFLAQELLLELYLIPGVTVSILEKLNIYGTYRR
ncbi:hypothetical protein ATANTOWER_014883 [Ataeniobius toweri]|uniref:Uncharacterized protein n=1 Tax=Ataeniobius toweri TaxID=208326 RepID=A0ABU7C239_9TELE|nr:hypothetical protein [Ataeniobius toweri]